MPATLGELGPARACLVEWLTALGDVSSVRGNDVMLVFVELLANAIEASRSSDAVAYSFSSTPTELVVRVENPNPFGQSVEVHTMPDPTAEGGRGLALAQQLSDRVDIDRMGGLVSISAHFRRG